MNITEFNNKRETLGVEGTGFTTITTKERVWTDKATKLPTFTIPAGSLVHVWFTPKVSAGTFFVQFGNEVKVSRTVTGSNWLKGFRKVPTMRTLQKQDWNGIVMTPTGKKVEPDGFGPDGSPSWMLVVGII